MKKTDTMSVIYTLDTIFSVCELPQEIVTDDGPPFNRFCAANEIHLPDTPALHPHTTGAAEMSVRTAKATFNKMLLELAYEFSVSEAYRTYTVRGKSPNDLLSAFKPKTVWEMIKPRRSKMRINSTKDHFEMREKVWFRVNSKLQK